MKSQTLFKKISIVSYLLIILMGDMIGLPFFFWLFFTLFDFGKADQFFAWLAVMGLYISLYKLRSTPTLKIVLIDIGCFALMASPLVYRLSVVPIEKFNYVAFILPSVIFIVFYFLSILSSLRKYILTQKIPV